MAATRSSWPRTGAPASTPCGTAARRAKCSRNATSRRSSTAEEPRVLGLAPHPTEVPMDTDEVLKGLARESVKQGENLRSAVRELTLSALRGRELTVDQIKRVVRTVTEGVNLGAATSKLDADQVLGEAFSG